jgi:hypothetical protein
LEGCGRPRTRAVPAVERIASWLTHHRPPSGPEAIVHGDYRLGNLLACEGETSWLPASARRFATGIDVLLERAEALI